MAETYFETIMRHQIAEGRYDHGDDPQDGKVHFTIGELYSAVLDIDNDEDARRFFGGYVEWLAGRPDCDDPEAVAKSNIGWIFGEGMAQDRIAVWVRAVDAAHPVFGKMTIKPTVEEALQAGMNLGRGILC